MTALVWSARVSARAPHGRSASAARRGGHTSARRPASRRSSARRGEAHWEIRSFGAASGAIVAAFLLALVYLTTSTGVATVGYEAQRLQAERDELRRQNALLEVQLAKLSSPSRIETEAKRLGLVRLSFVPVVPADPLSSPGDPLSSPGDPLSSRGDPLAAGR